MADLQQAASKELHPQAEQLARAYIDEFADSLLLQSKVLAVIQKTEVVLSQQVEEARAIIIREEERAWPREFLIILGSAFFGAFLQGFLTELASGRGTLVAIYTIVGFAGMMMVFLGLRK